MIYLWDTDTLSAWQYAPLRFEGRLARLGPDDSVTVSVVTAYEVLRGRMVVVGRAQQETEHESALALFGRALDALNQWRVLPYTAHAASEFPQLRKGRGSHSAHDLRIAATALAQGAVLVTRNVRHFEGLPGLVVQDWLE